MNIINNPNPNISRNKRTGKPIIRSIESIDRLVFHSMMEFLTLEGLHATQFLEEEAGYSAHYLITPSGTIIKTVDIKNIAWHAAGFNRTSIGIEWLVPGYATLAEFYNIIKTDWVTESAFRAGVELVKNLNVTCNFKNFDTHTFLSPDRKQDPGDGFPLSELMGNISPLAT